MRVSRLGWLAFFFLGSSPPFSPPLSFTIVRCSTLGAPRHPSPVDFGTAHSTHMKTREGFHVQAARPQLRDLARRVRRRPPPGTEGPTRRGWCGAARLVPRHARVSRADRK